MICEGGAGSPFSCTNDFLINTRKNFNAAKITGYTVGEFLSDAPFSNLVLASYPGRS